MDKDLKTIIILAVVGSACLCAILLSAAAFFTALGFAAFGITFLLLVVKSMLPKRGR